MHPIASGVGCQWARLLRHVFAVDANDVRLFGRSEVAHVGTLVVPTSDVVRKPGRCQSWDHREPAARRGALKSAIVPRRRWIIEESP